MFRRPSYGHQHLHYNYHHQTSCNNCAVFSLFHAAYFIISNNNDLNKENHWIKQVLQEKGYQEGFISKIFARIAVMVCLSQNSKHKPQISEKNIVLHLLVLHLLLSGISNLTSLTKTFFCIYKFHILCWFLLTDYFFYLWICELQAILSGNMELTPGPKPNSGQKFSLCHWNLNSIPGYNFSKIPLLSTCNSLNVLVIIRLPETYLELSILAQDPNVEMHGYMLIRAEHPSSFKTRGSLHLLQKTFPLETF